MNATMIQSVSQLSTLSPLGRAPAPARKPPASEEPEDRLLLSPTTPAEEPPRKRGSGWKQAILGGALGVTVLASLAGAATAPGQVLIQQILHPQGQAQDLVGQLQGYAGESATDREAVIQGLQENLPLLDAPAGHHQDGLIGVSDLHRVAADPKAPEAARDSAQAVLADPVLLDTLDVATGARVDHLISQSDLEQAWRNEQGGDFGTFDQVRQMLESTTGDQTAFDYFDSLGRQDDLITSGDLSEALRLSSTPDPFRSLAQDLLANPNYLNAFDVASSTNSSSLLAPFHTSNYRDGRISAEDLQSIAYAPVPESGRQFSEADQVALDRVLSGEATLDNDLFQSFFQTNRGNCASTATIKAAMEQFGPNLFEEVEKQPDGSYNITMKDGFTLRISPSELEAAATATHYGGNDPETKAMANLSYASMAKRAWAMGHEGAQTYGEALFSLNNGEITGNVPTYLGLRHHVKFIDVDEVPKHDGAVVYGNGHAYFVDRVNGQSVGDKWGTATPYQGKVSIDEGAKQDNAFVLRP